MALGEGPLRPGRLLLLFFALQPARSLELRELSPPRAGTLAQADTERSLSMVTSAYPLQVSYSTANYLKCLNSWQVQCRHNWEGDDIAIGIQCNSSLDRPHLKSHLLLTAADVRSRMWLGMERHWQSNAMPRLFVPRFTAVGWKLVMPPAELHERVVEWYESQRYRMIAEDWPSVDDVGCNNNYDNDDFLIPHNEAPPVMAMSRYIKEQLQEWFGTEVDPSFRIFYGARLQRRGGTCGLHVDMGQTHIMSATYNIAQKRQTKPWPLAFVEPGGQVSKVEQQPGHIVFYEGGSGMHGRPEPLEGEEFVSIYFHFRPKDWTSRYARSLPTGSSFRELVQVQEPQRRMRRPVENVRALEDGSCPADSDDTHGAAGLPDLWRGARTAQRRAFDPAELSEADVLRVLAAAPDAGGALQADGRRVLLLEGGADGSLGDERRAWEAAALLAQASGRTLVLPGQVGLRPHALLRELDIDRLRAVVPVMTSEQYREATGSATRAALAAASPAGPLCAAAAAGRALSEAAENAAEALAFSAQAHRSGPCSSDSGLWRLAEAGRGRRLLQHGFAWAAPLREAAAQAVHRLGLWDFVALHARDVSGTRVPADVTLARWVPYLQPGSTLYVAGDADAAGSFAGKGGPLNVTVVTWEDLKFDVPSTAKEPVEELICAYARMFVGASSSAGFTGRVRRLRKERRAPTTAALHHQDSEGEPWDILAPNNVAAELSVWRLSADQEVGAAALLELRRAQLSDGSTVEVGEDLLRGSFE